MQFRTQIPISKNNHPIGYNSGIVSLGSCFAVNIGEKFNYYKFQAITNPFGILFHPLALEKFIGFVINQKQFTETDIFYHNERWHCFDAHSDLSNANRDNFLANLNTTVAQAYGALQKASHLIITLGTSWIYKSIETGQPVANCHKVPQKQFTKELLDTETIKQSLHSIIRNSKNFNPNLQIIFTVSPVRHIKDGFIENQWSKANLITALHEVLSSNSETVSYFPSYEIMMDELRDYRFYAEDMIHPNQIAVDYIWERFTEGHISPETATVMKEVDSIQKALQHKPFNPESEQYKEFLSKVSGRIDSCPASRTGAARRCRNR